KSASRLLILVLAAASLAGGAQAEPGPTPEVVAERVRVYGADAEHQRLVRWALLRYQHAGLHVPPIDVHFHPHTLGCYGHIGSELAGRIDICVVIVSEIARDALLHEMGHAWVDENVSAAVRERFMAMRGLTAWNDQSVIWDERGFEHAAETLAWALGHRFFAPEIPDHDPERLTAAFELLTGGLPLPHPGNLDD
ncbi:MAG TPA: hypothetical protein VKC55_04600, partial [Actinomycetota bacterium]|nr:hypothetical protein [Actinomycetota bacterium]